MKKLAVLLTILILIACTQINPLPPVDINTECFGFTDAETILSVNPCLEGPFSTDNSIGIIQAVPVSWSIANILKNVNGYADQYTERAKIECDSFRCSFDLYNSVVGINGYWGYYQEVNLVPGCKLYKATGRSWINDPPNAGNYVMNFYLDTELIGNEIIPMQDEFQLIYSVDIPLAGEYTIQFMIQSLWATPGHESTIDLISLGLLEVDSGYCE